MKGDASSPQVLANLLTEAEAALLVNHLDSLGIKSYVSGSGTPGWPEVPSDVHQVMVRQADLARAREALDLIRRKRTETETGDVGRE